MRSSDSRLDFYVSRFTRSVIPKTGAFKVKLYFKNNLEWTRERSTRKGGGVEERYLKELKKRHSHPNLGPNLYTQIYNFS